MFVGYGVLSNVLHVLPVPPTARVYLAAGVERPQVQAAAVLSHAALRGRRRAGHTAIQVCLSKHYTHTHILKCTQILRRDATIIISFLYIIHV